MHTTTPSFLIDRGTCAEIMLSALPGMFVDVSWGRIPGITGGMLHPYLHSAVEVWLGHLEHVVAASQSFVAEWSRVAENSVVWPLVLW